MEAGIPGSTGVFAENRPTTSRPAPSKGGSPIQPLPPILGKGGPRAARAAHFSRNSRTVHSDVNYPPTTLILNIGLNFKKSPRVGQAKHLQLNFCTIRNKEGIKHPDSAVW